MRPVTRPETTKSIAKGLFQIVPGAQTAGLFVRQQDVTFRLDPLPVDHDVDQIAGLNLDTAIGLHELFDGNQAFGLVAEIDDDVGIVPLDYTPLSNSPSCGGAKWV